MTTPAPGTSARLLIIGGGSAGVGLLLMFILPLTYGDSYDPWQSKRFGSAVVNLFGGVSTFAVLLGAVMVALAILVRGFEPQTPRPAAPQGYPQSQYPGQYAQPQTGYAQPQTGYAQPQAGQVQMGQPVPPDQGGSPQQQWGGSGS